MAISQISICNSALVKIGADRISTIDQSTKSATCLNALYNQVRDDLLRGHPWNFAIKRATLSPNATTPAFGYTYSYDQPQDCLRVLIDDDDEVNWVFENAQILSNETSLDMLYIFRQTDESAFDPMFAEVFSWRLAREVSYALTHSSAVYQFCDKAYKENLALARSMDGAEGIIRPIVTDLWTGARRRGLSRIDITKM